MTKKQALKRLLGIALLSISSLSNLDATFNFFKKSAKTGSAASTALLVASIYNCNEATQQPLLAASFAQATSIPAQIKPAVQNALESCSQPFVPPTPSCPGTLQIEGSISIKNSKDVAITVTSLSKITAIGYVEISIPSGGSFKINGTPYTSSPIRNLVISQNSTTGVRIDCSDQSVSLDYGVYIGQVTLEVKGDIQISENTATSDTQNAYGIYNAFGTIKATGNGAITISKNDASTTTSGGSAFAIFNNDSWGNIIATESSTLTISENTASTTSSSESAYAMYNGNTITSTGSGAITISDNTATVSNPGTGLAYGIYNFNIIMATGSGPITISDNTASSYGGSAYGFYNFNTTTATGSGAITISGNTATALFAFGFDNNGTVTGKSTIIISTNEATVTSGSGFAYGFNNAGSNASVAATGSGALTISGNAANSKEGDAYGFNNYKTITGSGALTISDNTATVTSTSGSASAYGVYNYSNSTITGSGALTISDNTATVTSTSGRASAYGVYSDNNNSSITGIGALTISGNTAATTSTSGNVVAIGIYNGSTITGDSTLTISDNTATATSTSGSEFAVGFGSDDTITATGAITISENIATSGNGLTYGVVLSETLETSDAIAMNHNQGSSTNSPYGVYINPGSVIKQSGSALFTIEVTDSAYQAFNSAAVAITDLASTALSFNKFAITINTDTYGSSGGNYFTMSNQHPNIVVLNAANQ